MKSARAAIAIGRIAITGRTGIIIVRATIIGRIGRIGRTAHIAPIVTIDRSNCEQFEGPPQGGPFVLSRVATKRSHETDFAVMRSWVGGDAGAGACV